MKNSTDIGDADALAQLIAGLLAQRVLGVINDDRKSTTAEADGNTIVGRLYSTSLNTYPVDWWAELHIGQPPETESGEHADPEDMDLEDALHELAVVPAGGDERAAVEAMAREIRWLRGMRDGLRTVLRETKADRDRARDIAVALEQENSELWKTLEGTQKYLANARELLGDAAQDITMTRKQMENT